MIKAIVFDNIEVIVKSAYEKEWVEFHCKNLQTKGYAITNGYSLKFCNMLDKVVELLEDSGQHVELFYCSDGNKLDTWRKTIVNGQYGTNHNPSFHVFMGSKEDCRHAANIINNASYLFRGGI